VFYGLKSIPGENRLREIIEICGTKNQYYPALAALFARLQARSLARKCYSQRHLARRSCDARLFNPVTCKVSFAGSL
jgi:hypothetical protein